MISQFLNVPPVSPYAQMTQQAFAQNGPPFGPPFPRNRLLRKHTRALRALQRQYMNNAIMRSLQGPPGWGMNGGGPGNPNFNGMNQNTLNMPIIPPGPSTGNEILNIETLNLGLDPLVRNLNPIWFPQSGIRDERFNPYQFGPLIPNGPNYKPFGVFTPFGAWNTGNSVLPMENPFYLYSSFNPMNMYPYYNKMTTPYGPQNPFGMYGNIPNWGRSAYNFNVYHDPRHHVHQAAQVMHHANADAAANAALHAAATAAATAGQDVKSAVPKVEEKIDSSENLLDNSTNDKSQSADANKKTRV